LRRIQALELKAREVAEGVQLGVHHAPHRGRSIEFAEHKEYSPGDDIRRIDWKVYGKSDRLYIKEYEDETNITALMLVDASRSMGYQGGRTRGPDPLPAKLDHARVMAAALAHLLLNQSDSVGLGLFAGKLGNFLPPRARQAHFHEVTARLAALELENGTDLTRVLSDLSALIKGRAMIIVFSDLLDEPETMLKALRLLRSRRHEIVIFHVLDPDEIEFPFDRLTDFHDLESTTRLLVDPRAIRDQYLIHFGAFQDDVRRECRGRGIDYRMARTDEPAVKLLTSWLFQRAAIQRLRRKP
jgi:uncharacterized protein (DUF58 family)